MSYAYDPLEDERRKKESQEEQSLGGGSGSVISGQNQAPQQQSGNKGSGQFVNLQNYLNDSNKNLGLDIANRLGQDVSAAEEEQDKAKTSFTQAVDSGTTKKDESNINFVTSNPFAAQQGYNQESLAKKMAEQTTQRPSQQTAQQTQQPSGSLSTMGLRVGPVLPGKTSPVISKDTISSATTQQTPTAQTQQVTQTKNPFLDKIGDPIEFQRFIAQRDAMYKGPQATEDENFYGGAREKTRQAQEYGSALGTEQGKKAALQKYYGAETGRPDYSQGQRNLDMYLGFSSPEAKQALAAQQEKARSLGDRFSGIQSELNNYRSQGIANTQAARRAARDAIGIDDSGNLIESGAVNNFKNYLAQ
ncbi:hypothetical protein EBZ39_17590, partial [bacterium]|nr:hypothetical protein [bacterium]